MSDMMRALVLLDDHGTFEMRDVPVPEIGDDDILVEVKGCGICGGDYKRYMGPEHGGWYKMHLPVITGHEFAGVIAKLGRNVDKYWKVGDRIVSDNTGDACGRCPTCARGNFVNCPQRKCIGVHMDGAFAKYVKVPGKILKMFPNCIMKIPDNMTFGQAAAMEPAANSYKAIVQEAALRPGENVAIIGTGSLGLMAIQIAKISGAANIIAIGTTKDKAYRFKVAEKYGATHFFCTDEDEDIPAKIAEIVGEDGVPVVAEIAGPPQLTNLAMQIIRNEGRFVRVGMDDRPYNYGLNVLNFKSINYQGHKGYNTESWKNLLSLAKAGILDLQSYLTAEVPLENWREGFEILRRGEGAKVVLVP